MNPEHYFRPLTKYIPGYSVAIAKTPRYLPLSIIAETTVLQLATLAPKALTYPLFFALSESF